MRRLRTTIGVGLAGGVLVAALVAGGQYHEAGHAHDFNWLRVLITAAFGFVLGAIAGWHSEKDGR